jgi:hypothetical protein
MTVLAHAGHWIEGGIFAAPVVIVAVALGVSSMRERKRRRQAGQARKAGKEGKQQPS